MRAVVYGIGKEYFKIFNNADLVHKIIGENGFEIIGFSDGDKNRWGTELIYNGQKFTVRDISGFQSEHVERILITTHKYYDEIRIELLGRGYKEEQILPVQNFYKSYKEQLLCVKELEGKAGVEIGGPTKLFSEIYSKCFSCDNVNFSLNTVWGQNETRSFCYKDRCLGNILVMDATDMSGIEDKNMILFYLLII